MHQNITNSKHKLLIQIGVPEKSKSGISQRPESWQTYPLKSGGLIEKPTSQV